MVFPKGGTEIETAVLLLVYTLAGFALKLGDDLLDELDRSDLSWVPLSAAGILFGIIAVTSEWGLALIAAVVLGVSLSGKVNRPQFGVGFVLIAAFLLVMGIPLPSDWLRWVALVSVMVLAAAIDEKGNNWADNAESSILAAFFAHRFMLKISVVIISFIIIEFALTAIGLWLFDLGYEVASRITARLKLRDGDAPDCSTHQ